MTPRARKLSAAIQSALAEQWGRPAVDRVQIDLPLPVSANDLWQRGAKGLIKTDRYRSWIRAAGNLLAVQDPGRIDGRYTLLIEANRRRNTADLDNIVKAISDLLQAHHVIVNDRLAERITLAWSDEIPGCRVVVERWPGSHAA